MACEHCKKEPLERTAEKKLGIAFTFVIEAAPPVKDKELRKQLDAEGRGAAAGEGEICMWCYRDGLKRSAA